MDNFCPCLYFTDVSKKDVFEKKKKKIYIFFGKITDYQLFIISLNYLYTSGYSVKQDDAENISQHLISNFRIYLGLYFYIFIKANLINFSLNYGFNENMINSYNIQWVCFALRVVIYLFCT